MKKIKKRTKKNDACGVVKPLEKHCWCKHCGRLFRYKKNRDIHEKNCIEIYTNKNKYKDKLPEVISKKVQKS
jgi:hypothetical protein